MATVREFKATARPRAGKGAARAVRREGRVPGVIYGDNQPPLNISLDQAELAQRIFAGKFLTTLCEVDVEGNKIRVIPRDFQIDSVSDAPVHVDFMRLGKGATIRVRVPIHIINADQSPGIKRGGTVNVVTHTLDVRCPAEAIPEAFVVDLAGLEINNSRHLSDINLPPDVRPYMQGDATLITIVPPSGYAEEKGGEGAVAPAAAAPAAGGDKKAAAAGGAKPAAGGAKPAAGGAKPAAGGAKPAAGGGDKKPAGGGKK
jgi:large subunit ribosomal protein L25